MQLPNNVLDDKTHAILEKGWLNQLRMIFCECMNTYKYETMRQYSYVRLLLVGKYQLITMGPTDIYVKIYYD